MVDEQKYFDELQEIIGKTKSADEINERWNEVLSRLDELAVEYARELQSETRIKYLKFGKEREDIWQFPPYRLLAMNIILSRWVGWIGAPNIRKQRTLRMRLCQNINDNLNASYLPLSSFGVIVFLKLTDSSNYMKRTESRYFTLACLSSQCTNTPTNVICQCDCHHYS